MLYQPSPALKKILEPANSCSQKQQQQQTNNSAFNINLEEHILQDGQLLVGLLNGTVRLHIAGDVVADVVHQGDRVGHVTVLQRIRVLFDDLCKLCTVHQLRKTNALKM